MRQRALAPEVGLAVAKGGDRKTGTPRGGARRVPPLVGLSILAALASIGCHPKAKVAPDVSPVGSFALVSVDGNPVPHTVKHGGAPVTIQAGTFVIDAGGTCISKMVFVPPSGRETSREVKATYTRQGATLTMKWEGAGTTTGSIEGNTFTMGNEGMIFTYRR